MGTYIYSLRKAHKEARLEGIYPIDVMPLRFAYKLSDPWPGESGYAPYQRMVGRVESQADKAQDHHYDRARNEFGDIEDRWFYVSVGGDKDFQEGLRVYRTKNIPALWCDGGGIPGAEYVGKLFKIGRKWVVSKECPGHVWKETESHKGHFDPNMPMQWYPARTCKRCDHSEYLDPELEAAKQAYDAERDALKEAA